MRVNRRGLLTGAIAGAAMFLMSLGASPAWAVTADQARAHVQQTIDELTALLRQPGGPEARAPGLRSIVERRGNLPRIAQFSAGRVWRDMTPDQQQRFVRAFADYAARTYSRRFDEYAGNPQITIGRVIDAGQKGILVETPVRQGGGQPLRVDWLVSDRGGRIEIVDLIVEGVSMAASQREEIASMFQRHGNDVDALIAYLAGG